MGKILTKLGEGGRLVIPAEYRRALGVDTGDELVLVLEERTMRVLTPREAVRRAQALVRSYIPEGRSLSEELISERRRESEIE
jgi:bifunctional DNA-binding transcriptional regulator/antitoxin component of YhaV-PrlF toxin-antitoxin module